MPDTAAAPHVLVTEKTKQSGRTPVAELETNLWAGQAVKKQKNLFQNMPVH
jgi:hypothetical protein